MPADPEAPVPTAPPGPDQLAGLPDEVWRRLVPHLRRALAALPEGHHTTRTRQLAALPARRLVTGRARRDVERQLAAGGPLWSELRTRIVDDPDLATVAGRALARAAGDHDDDLRPGQGPVDEAPVDDQRDEELDRLRDRLRRVRQERDDARRRADGEAARADREAAARAELTTTVSRLERRVDQLAADLAAATREREAAVDRERRRARAARDELREQLREVRREQQEQQRRRRARARAQEVRERRPDAPAEPAAPRLAPGRPSRLPAGVAHGTTEAVDLLLHAGREVLVDGYNVTRGHRPDLDLEGQRRWLVNLLVGAAAARGIEPTVVFDGHGTGGPGSDRRDRGVWVRFTSEGTTADDDLVFQVEATDPATPLVVVTDDGELRERLAPARVDLVSTAALVGALR